MRDLGTGAYVTIFYSCFLGGKRCQPESNSMFYVHTNITLLTLALGLKVGGN